jgi:glycosyltransferase involved in cell wall biosynthesis
MKEKILFVGLVDMNKIKGDSNHFRKLTTFMEDHFETFIISFTNNTKENHATISYPKYKLLRLLYWNIYIFYLICKYYWFKQVKIIYFRESGFVISPYLASFLFNIKLYVEINGVTTDDLPISKNIIRFLFNNFYKTSHKFIASKGYAQLINSNFKVPYSKIHTVSLGFDILPQNNNNKNNKFPVKTIVFIGNIVKYQGLELFLDGYSIYVKTIDATIKFLIIGEGNQKDFLFKKVEDLNLKNNVSFLPPIPSNELHQLLNKCHLGISTFSQKRGTPHTISALKTFDYINARLPILTSDMDEMSEFIEVEKIGEVIYNYIPLEYCDKISKCLSNNFLDSVESTYEKKFKELINTFSWNTRFDSIKSMINN